MEDTTKYDAIGFKAGHDVSRRQSMREKKNNLDKPENGNPGNRDRGNHDNNTDYPNDSSWYNTWGSYKFAPMPKRLNRTNYGESPPLGSSNHGDDQVLQKDWDAEIHKVEKEPKTITGVLRRFAEHTSMQGIPFINRSPHLRARIFWVLVTLSFTVAGAIQAYYVSADYFSYNTVTSVTLGYDTLQFPSVRLCNINPVRSSAVQVWADKELRDFLVSIASNTALLGAGKDRQDQTAGQGTSAPGTGGGVPGPGTSAPGTGGGVPGVPRPGASTPGTGGGVPSTPGVPGPGTSAPEVDIPTAPAPFTTPSDAATGITTTTTPADSTTIEDRQTVTTDVPDTTTTVPVASTDAVTTVPVASTDAAITVPVASTDAVTTVPVASTDDATTVPVAGTITTTTVPVASTDATTTDPVATTAQPPPRPGGPRPGRRRRGIGSDFSAADGADDLDEGEQAFLQGLQNSTMSARVERFDIFRELFAKQNRSSRNRLSNPLGATILECSFNGLECTIGDLTTSFESSYGNCFSFNSASFDTRPLRSATSGPTYGLTLTVHIANAEYVDGLGLGKGVKLSVYPYATSTFVHESGLSLAPGLDHFIGMRMINVSRLGEPYEPCDDNGSFANLYTGKKYTKEACTTTCLDRHIAEKCHCYRPAYENYYGKESLLTLEECDTDDENTSNCLNTQINLFILGRLDCGCNSACISQNYDLQMSSNKWPDASSYYELVDMICQSDEVACDRYLALEEGEREQALLDNVLKINLYYRDLNYENFEEAPAYELSQFVSDFGGTVGLWVGASLLTVVEFINLFLECCNHCCRRKVYRERKARRAEKIRDPSLIDNRILSNGYAKTLPGKPLRHQSVADNYGFNDNRNTDSHL